MIALAGRTLELVACPAPEFVYGTWLRSYRKAFAGEPDAPAWFDSQRAIVADLMPLVRCLVASTSPKTIHAWVCATPGVLHYVYVPRDLRGNKIGRHLVAAVAGEKGVHTHLRAPYNGFETYDPHALADALRSSWKGQRAA